MTTEPQEGGVEQVSAGVPTPTFTETSPVSATSTGDPDALVDKIVAKLTPTVEKLVQSQKDKRIASIEKKLEAAGLSELEEMGVQIPENVKLEYRLRQLEAQKPVVQEPSTAKGGPQNSDQVARVIAESGLDANKPEVIALLSGQYRNLDHFTAEAYRLRARLSQPQQPNPADAPALHGTDVHAGGPSAETLKKDYQAELAKIAQTLKGDEKIRAIASLKSSYQQKGLDVN